MSDIANVNELSVSTVYYDSATTNLGIGTASPLSKLSVIGGVHIGGASDAGNNNLLVEGNVTITSLGSGFVVSNNGVLGVTGIGVSSGGDVSGTAGYIAKFRDSSTVINSNIFINGTDTTINGGLKVSTLGNGFVLSHNGVLGVTGIGVSGGGSGDVSGVAGTVAVFRDTTTVIDSVISIDEFNVTTIPDLNSTNIGVTFIEGATVLVDSQLTAPNFAAYSDGVRIKDIGYVYRDATAGYSQSLFSVDNMSLAQLDSPYFGHTKVSNTNSDVTGFFDSSAQVGPSAFWYYLAMSSDGKNQMATSSSGTFKSNDYGSTWVQVNSFNFNAIAISSDGKIQLASINSGTLYVSHDYGESFQSTAVSDSWAGVAISGDGRYQYAVNFNHSGNNYYRSNDYGSTWISWAIGYPGPSRVATSSDGRLVTVTWSAAGSVWLFDNYGANTAAFGNFGASYQANTYGLAMSDNGKYQTAVVSGNSGSNFIFTSKDYGLTWFPKKADSALTSICISGNGKIQIATSSGASGNVFLSEDFGDTWVIKNSQKHFLASTMSNDGKVLLLAPSNSYPNPLYSSYSSSITHGNTTIIGGLKVSGLGNGFVVSNNGVLGVTGIGAGGGAPVNTANYIPISTGSSWADSGLSKDSSGGYHLNTDTSGTHYAEYTTPALTIKSHGYEGLNSVTLELQNRLDNTDVYGASRLSFTRVDPDGTVSLGHISSYGDTNTNYELDISLANSPLNPDGQIMIQESLIYLINTEVGGQLDVFGNLGVNSTAPVAPDATVSALQTIVSNETVFDSQFTGQNTYYNSIEFQNLTLDTGGLNHMDSGYVNPSTYGFIRQNDASGGLLIAGISSGNGNEGISLYPTYGGNGHAVAALYIHGSQNYGNYESDMPDSSVIVQVDNFGNPVFKVFGNGNVGVLGGVHVGGFSDAGTNNLLVEGKVGLGTSPDKLLGSLHITSSDTTSQLATQVGNTSTNLPVEGSPEGAWHRFHSRPVYTREDHGQLDSSGVLQLVGDMRWDGTTNYVGSGFIYVDRGMRDTTALGGVDGTRNMSNFTFNLEDKNGTFNANINFDRDADFLGSLMFIGGSVVSGHSYCLGIANTYSYPITVGYWVKYMELGDPYTLNGWLYD